MNSNTFDFVCDVDWMCFRLEIVRGVSVIAFSDSAVAYWFNVQRSTLGAFAPARPARGTKPEGHVQLTTLR